MYRCLSTHAVAFTGRRYFKTRRYDKTGEITKSVIRDNRETEGQLRTRGIDKIGRQEIRLLEKSKI